MDAHHIATGETFVVVNTIHNSLENFLESYQYSVICSELHAYLRDLQDIGLARAHNGLFTLVEVIHRNFCLKYLNYEKAFMGCLSDKCKFPM